MDKNSKTKNDQHWCSSKSNMSMENTVPEISNRTSELRFWRAFSSISRSSAKYHPWFQLLSQTSEIMWSCRHEIWESSRGNLVLIWEFHSCSSPFEGHKSIYLPSCVIVFDLSSNRGERNSESDWSIQIRSRFWRECLLDQNNKVLSDRRLVIIYLYLRCEICSLGCLFQESICWWQR